MAGCEINVVVNLLPCLLNGQDGLAKLVVRQPLERHNHHSSRIGFTTPHEVFLQRKFTIPSNHGSKHAVIISLQN